MASNSFPPPPYTHTPGNTNEHEAALLADTTAWIPGATTSQLPRVGRLEVHNNHNVIYYRKAGSSSIETYRDTAS